MDRFIKIESEKNTGLKPLFQEQLEILRGYIKENKNVFVVGHPGIGKTTFVKTALSDTKNYELDADSIKFYNLVENSDTNIFIDDYDFDTYSLKKLVDDASEGKKKSNGAFIVISDKFVLYPNFETIVLEKHSPETLLSLVDDKDRWKYEESAWMADGNINFFFNYGQFKFQKDMFKTTKEYVNDILCSEERVVIKDILQEHGSFWDTIHENYLDSKDCNAPKIIDALSLASLYDILIYDGDWGAMKFFVNEVLRIPKYYMGEPLDPNKIRPGSCWSKTGNHKMRKQRVRNILIKGPIAMHQDHLYLIRHHASNGNFDVLKTYNINANDFDIINHLAVGNKLKPKEVNFIKKTLRETPNE